MRRVAFSLCAVSHLAATVVLARRTGRTAEEIRAAVPGAQVDGFVADLSSQAEIRRVVEKHLQPSRLVLADAVLHIIP